MRTVSYTHLDVYKRQIPFKIVSEFCRSGRLLVERRKHPFARARTHAVTGVRERGYALNRNASVHSAYLYMLALSSLQSTNSSERYAKSDKATHFTCLAIAEWIKAGQESFRASCVCHLLWNGLLCSVKLTYYFNENHYPCLLYTST